jgi:hypothetical protein
MAGNARCRQGETRDKRPMLGDYAWSCGSWSLYSATGNIPMALSEAIIATYMTIHMARSPRFTQWENCVSLPGVPGGSGNPAGVAFRQRRRAFVGDQSQRVLSVRSALLGQRYARLELKGQIGVVVVCWDWGTGEWAKSSTLLSCGAAFGTVL